MKIAPHLRRSWLFTALADGPLADACAAKADVVILDLEDFTPVASRAAYRLSLPRKGADVHQASARCVLRINPLDSGGRDDLVPAIGAGATGIMLAKADHPDQIRDLDDAIAELERRSGVKSGLTEIIPCLESAAGLTLLYDIAKASTRVTSALIASEDLANDLGVARTAGSQELVYARSKFYFDCVAAGIFAVDCPFTFEDRAAEENDMRFSLALGFKAKSSVSAGQVASINAGFTPSRHDIDRSKDIVRVYEAALANGSSCVELDGNLIEAPSYKAATRLLARAQSFGLL